MSRMYHGAHTRFSVHQGLCLTDDAMAAGHYACEGEVATMDVDLSGLRLVEIDGYDPETNTAPGDDGNDHGADVLIYADSDPNGWTHRTWRLMSAAAVARITVVSVVDASDFEE